MYSKEIHLYINFYIMKTKINAVDIYMSTDEVKKALIWKDLNFKDEIVEKIDFLEDIKESNIFIKWYDEDKVKISKYENSKNYIFPINILRSEETEEIKEIQESEEKIKFNYQKIINWLFILITIILISMMIIQKSFRDPKIEEKEVLTYEQEFNILNSKIEVQNTIIKNELLIQKKLRIAENESIERVKESDKIKKDLELNMILFSNQLK